jgi:hypothetical protein
MLIKALRAGDEGQRRNGGRPEHGPLPCVILAIPFVRSESDAMDRLDHFPRVWCPTCNKVQRLIFDVLKANDKNEHDAADIVCAECKSIIATLHAPDARWAGVRDKKVAKASEIAAQEIDRLIDPSATAAPQARRLITGPKEFRHLSGKRRSKNGFQPSFWSRGQNSFSKSESPPWVGVVR